MQTQPFVEPTYQDEPMELLTPEQRTKMVAEILATIALRVMKQQEQHEPEQTL